MSPLLQFQSSDAASKTPSSHFLVYSSRQLLQVTHKQLTESWKLTYTYRRVVYMKNPDNPVKQGKTKNDKWVNDRVNLTPEDTGQVLQGYSLWPKRWAESVTLREHRGLSPAAPQSQKPPTVPAGTTIIEPYSIHSTKQYQKCIPGAISKFWRPLSSLLDLGEEVVVWACQIKSTILNPWDRRLHKGQLCTKEGLINLF